MYISLENTSSTEFENFSNISYNLNSLWEVVLWKKELVSNLNKLYGPFFDTVPNKNFLRRVILETGKNLGTNMNLLFRASKDGFKASDFHRLCDNKGPTLTFIKAKNGFYFGGYSSVDWDSSNSFKKASGSFLFSFNHQTIMNIYQNEGNAICCDPIYGPVFGRGSDFCIYDNSNANNNSFSNLGQTYKCVFLHNSAEANKYLAGSYNFSVEDYEVYSFYW